LGIKKGNVQVLARSFQNEEIEINKGYGILTTYNIAFLKGDLNIHLIKK